MKKELKKLMLTSEIVYHRPSSDSTSHPSFCQEAHPHLCHLMNPPSASRPSWKAMSSTELPRGIQGRTDGFSPHTPPPQTTYILCSLSHCILAYPEVSHLRWSCLEGICLKGFV